jgi:hypothetical protein
MDKNRIEEIDNLLDKARGVLDKTLEYLSASGIGLVFLILNSELAYNNFLLKFSLILFSISLISLVLSHISYIKSLDEIKKDSQCWKIYDKLTGVLNKVARGSFLFGLI